MFIQPGTTGIEFNKSGLYVVYYQKQVLLSDFPNVIPPAPGGRYPWPQHEASCARQFVIISALRLVACVGKGVLQQG